MATCNFFPPFTYLKFLAILLVLSVISHEKIFALPINNYQDPVIFHTVMGSDKFYTPTNKAGLSFHMSPFYQHTKSASKPNGAKTSNGNVQGPWNMAGIFLNAPANIATGLGSPVPNATQAYFTTNQTNVNNYFQDSLPNGITLDQAFNPEIAPYKNALYEKVVLRYEKMGLRGQLNFDLGAGLGMAIKGGIVNLKSRPEAFYLQESFAIALGIIPPPAGSEATPLPAGADLTKAQSLYNSILSPAARRNIFASLKLDINDVEISDFEDLFANIYWHVPIKIKDDDEHVLNIVPYLSIGASAPLGRDRNPNKLFSVINGNDGFSGFTAEAALALDFPAMMQLSFGGGTTIFSSRTLTNQRVPTSYNQSGIYPWVTNITRTPGPVWYVNISMKADNIMSKKDIPNFSVYFDYIYTQHKQDKIIVSKQQNALAAMTILPGMLENNSAWKAQILHGGVKCALSKNIALTFAAQKSLPGARTFRPTTLLGGLTMNF